MKLQELLNKFGNENFLFTVNGLCDELSFYEYQDMKKEEYWKKYKDKKVKNIFLLITHDLPELLIDLE